MDNEKLMEELLTGLKGIQKSNLEILSRVINIEDRVTNIEENQVVMTERISHLERTTAERFSRIESKLNTVIVSNELMNYTYQSIKENHGLHAQFLLSLSKRIKLVEDKQRKNKDENNEEK